MMLPLLTLLLLGLTALDNGGHQAITTAVARTCPSAGNAPAPNMKKKRPKNTAEETQDAGACIELSFSALEIQEYLQSYARGQHWTILEEHMAEDSWTFSLALSKNELLAATKAGSNSEKVEWRSGIALVQVSSTQLADGFARTIVRAGYRGYGESADHFAIQREYWELRSNGSFEASVVSALKAHFKAVP